MKLDPLLAAYFCEENKLVLQGIFRRETKANFIWLCAIHIAVPFWRKAIVPFGIYFWPLFLAS